MIPQIKNRTPQIALVSLLAPVVLWKRRSWKLLALAVVPYIVVAIPLCLYNYVRFESFFEFGAKYNLTASNMSAYGSINPLGKITRIFVSTTIP